MIPTQETINFINRNKYFLYVAWNQHYYTQKEKENIITYYLEFVCSGDFDHKTIEETIKFYVPGAD